MELIFVCALLVLVSWLGGAMMQYSIIEDKVKSGMTPFISKSGTLEWRDAPITEVENNEGLD